MKEEPLDTGYDKVAVDNVAVKSEPVAGDDDEDDLNWVNDELDFLNEIEYDEVESGAANNENDQSKEDGEVEIPPESGADKGNGEAAQSSSENLKNNRKRKHSESTLEKQTSRGTTEPQVSVDQKESRTLEDVQEISNTSKVPSTQSDIPGASTQPSPVPPRQDEQPQTKESFVPVKIKQERISPPREIPTNCNEISESNDEAIFTRRVKQERLSPPPDKAEANVQQSNKDPKQPPLPSTPYTKPPPPVSSSRAPSKSSIEDDLAFLQKQREKVLAELKKTSQPASSSSEQPPKKRRAVSNEIPLPVKIKTEPVDSAYPQTSSNQSKNGSGLDADFENETRGTPLVKNPVALKLMPQPLKIKTEPVEDFDSSSRMSGSSHSSEGIHNWDDQPLSHRERVVKFAKETIKNFDYHASNPKIRRRFLYTPTAAVLENATQLSENRSPLCASNSIQYEFSSHALPINTAKFGITKFSEHTAKIVHLLGFNAYDLVSALKSKPMKSENEDPLESSTSAAYFVNAECQTEPLKCNKCIVRKLKMFADKATQASLRSTEAPLKSNSNPMYEGVSHSMLQTLNRLGSAQQTAIQEFSELLMGPAPASSHDVMRMRERLMDIFTLAQSQGGHSDHSAAESQNPSNLTTPAVLFNHPKPPIPKLYPPKPTGPPMPLFPSSGPGPGQLPGDYQRQHSGDYRQQHPDDYPKHHPGDYQQHSDYSPPMGHPQPVPEPYHQRNQMFPPSGPQPVPPPQQMHPQYGPPQPMDGYNQHQNPNPNYPYPQRGPPLADPRQNMFRPQNPHDPRSMRTNVNVQITPRRF